MATTTRGIVYPTTSNTITPLSNHFANLATSTDTAIATSEKTNAIPAVADTAARTALFPSPVQGNRVLRLDQMVIEAYYGTYNATTNKGGALSAGWYPMAGNTPRCKVVKNIAQTGGTSTYVITWNNAGAVQDRWGMYSTANNTRITAPVAGLYRVNYMIRTSGTSARTTTIRINGVATNLATGQVGTVGAATSPAQTAILSLAAGDYVEIQGIDAAAGLVVTGNDSTYFEMEYLEPRTS